MAFADKEAGFEDLSASFRSLYKSLFGSVGSNAPPTCSYTNDLQQYQTPPTGLSNMGYSADVIGTSITKPVVTMADTNKAPPFTSMMDNLKDIAEKNRWEMLNPTQIQSLRESFKSGSHKNFGMDQDTFLEWSHSFNQFLSQLDSHIPANIPASGIPHSSFQLSQQLPPPPPYSQHSSNTYATNSRMNPPFVPTLSNSSTSHVQLPLFRSAATDLLEDEEDFDWSKLV